MYLYSNERQMSLSKTRLPEQCLAVLPQNLLPSTFDRMVVRASAGLLTQRRLNSSVVASRTAVLSRIFAMILFLQ